MSFKDADFSTRLSFLFFAARLISSTASPAFPGETGMELLDVRRAIGPTTHRSPPGTSRLRATSSNPIHSALPLFKPGYAVQASD